MGELDENEIRNSTEDNQVGVSSNTLKKLIETKKADISKNNAVQVSAEEGALSS